MSIDIEPTNNWRKYIKNLKGQQHYLIFVSDLDSINISYREHQIGFCSHTTVCPTKGWMKLNSEEYIDTSWCKNTLLIKNNIFQCSFVHIYLCPRSVSLYIFLLRGSRSKLPPLCGWFANVGFIFFHIIAKRSTAYLYISVHFLWIHVCTSNCMNL